MTKNPYIGLFKVQFKGELNYKAKALSGIATQFFWGFLLIALYSSFMQGGAVNGFSPEQMSTYIWLGQAFLAIRYVQVLPSVYNEIMKGDVCYKFIRPISVYNQWFAEHVGYKLASATLRFAPIILVAFLLPTGYGMILPPTFWHFVLFLFAMAIGLLINVCISMVVIWLTFKTLNYKGTAGIVLAISGLLSGEFIPLPMMPVGVQNVINWLPFRFTADFPYQVYCGITDIKTTLIYLAVGIAWVVALLLLTKFLISRVCKKSVIQGG